MKNIPEKIYLLVEDENVDFSDTRGGIASTTKINKNDIVYHRLNRSKFVYLVVGIINGQINGCFNKRSKAERYVGNSERYYIQEIEVK